MKLPKEVRRHCPYCREHNLHSVGTAKQKSRFATHHLSRGSPTRVKARSLHGYGNWGKLSKKGAKDSKMKTKVTKRITITYKCKKCGKIHNIKKAIRSGRIEIGEKVSK